MGQPETCRHRLWDEQVAQAHHEDRNPRSSRNDQSDSLLSLIDNLSATLDDLIAERTKLLQTHYAGAVPLELLKTEQERVAERRAFPEAHIEAGTLDYEQTQARVKDRLVLAGDCSAIYMSIDDSLRRTANQAFFDKLYITEADAIDGEAGEPFDTLFNPEVQATALARQTAGGNGTDQAANVAGLNKDQLVPPPGFEPGLNGF